MSFFKRIAKKKDTTPRKQFEFTLTLHSLGSVQLKEGTSYAISAQRGKKTVQSTFKPVESSKQDTLQFQDEILKFECSLKELNDAFKSKSLRITVIEKSPKEKQAVQVKQDLSQFVSKEGILKKTVTFPLKKWKGNSNAKLTLSIESKNLGEADNNATETEVTTPGAFDSYLETDLDDLEELENDPAVSEMVGPTISTQEPTLSNEVPSSESGNNLIIEVPNNEPTPSESIPNQTSSSEQNDSNLPTPTLSIEEHNPSKPLLLKQNSGESLTSGFSDSVTGTDRPSEIQAEDRVALLLTTNQSVVESLYNTLREESSNLVSQALTDLARGIGSTSVLAKLLLYSELKHCTETNSEPLRSNSLTTKILERILASSVSTFIKSTFLTLLRELIENESLDFQLDPEKLGENGQEIALSNTSELISWCSKIFEKIFSSPQEIPILLRQICRYLKCEATRQGFDGTRVLANLLILRLLNPIISLPYAKGVVEKQPTETSKANCVFISRILQHIANRTQFNDAQPSSQELNSFIRLNYDACDNFLQNSVSSTREYDAEVFKTDKKIDTTLQKQVIANSIELKLSLQTVIKSIFDSKNEFEANYNCNDEDLNVMLRTGVPVHVTPRDTIRTEVSSIRRLFKKKKWTTAKSKLQSLEKKYINAENSIQLELSVLWGTLFNNRCLHYVKQSNGKKAVVYAQDALRYLNQHEKSLYFSLDKGFIYNLIVLNSETTLASYYFSEQQYFKAYQSISKAIDIMQDNEFREQINSDVLKLWILQAAKIAIIYFQQENSDESTEIEGEKILGASTLTPELKSSFSGLSLIASDCQEKYQFNQEITSLIQEMAA